MLISSKEEEGAEIGMSAPYISAGMFLISAVMTTLLERHFLNQDIRANVQSL
jgi:hypothetical protein